MAPIALKLSWVAAVFGAALSVIVLLFSLDPRPGTSFELEVAETQGEGRCSVQGAPFDSKDLSRCDFSGLDLSNLTFWSGTPDRAFVDADVLNMSGSSFFEADLSGADFRGVDLSSSSFLSSNLSGANFDGANLSGAFFRQVSCDSPIEWGTPRSFPAVLQLPPSCGDLPEHWELIGQPSLGQTGETLGGASRSVLLTVGGPVENSELCPSSACRFLKVEWSGFDGPVSVACSEEGVGEFYRYTATESESEVCFYGKVGGQVWVTANGNRSNEVRWPVEAEVSIPNEPSDLVAAAGPDWINLTWSPPVDGEGSGISRYELQSTGGATISTIGHVFRWEGLPEDLAKSFRVRACNSAGCSSWSAVVAVGDPFAPTVFAWWGSGERGRPGCSGTVRCYTTNFAWSNFPANRTVTVGCGNASGVWHTFSINTGGGDGSSNTNGQCWTDDDFNTPIWIQVDGVRSNNLPNND